MDNKKQNVLLVITLMVMIVLVFGATYAYFVAQTGAGQSANINVSANTTDSLMFEAGKSLSLFVTQANFGEGAGNQSDSTIAKAMLMANNKTNTARYTYNLYLNISKNDFVYTTEDETPEILLQITKPDGATLTSLEGLNYVTVKDISGFDITTKKGVINISLDKVIEVQESNTNHKTEEEWHVGIIFLNLDSDQQGNTGKTFVSKLMIQHDELLPTLAEYIVSTYGKDSTLYLHDSNLANGANDGSFRYSGANPNNFVCFGSDAEECPNDNLYRIIGVFGDQVKLIKHDYATASLLGTDGDYGDVNGVTTTSMEDKYLAEWGYKGTLKANEIGLYMYNYNGLLNHEGNNKYGSKDWSTSLLNKVNLNTNFLNNIGEVWSSKIATTIWSVGGVDNKTLEDKNVKAFFDVEQSMKKTYEAKVGLMYPSEYGFSVIPSYWTRSLAKFNGMYKYSWMNMNAIDWTIVPSSSYVSNALSMYFYGYVLNDYTNYGNPVRPTFSLESGVEFLGGSGSKKDPMRIR